MSEPLLHYSGKPLKKITKKAQSVGFKPTGLWYSCGTEWIKWAKAEQFDTPSDYVYQIQVNYSRILKLSSPQDLENFTEEYGTDILPDRDEDDDSFRYIDWPKVAQKYSGIEICPYVYEKRLTLLWYYGWDVASGCIWDPKAITKIDLIQSNPKTPKKSKK